MPTKSCLVCEKPYKNNSGPTLKRECCSRKCKGILSKTRWKDRFLKLTFKDENGCWVWLGSKTKTGYGMYHHYDENMKNKSVKAHRAAYVEFVGKVMDGLTLDHLCKNRLCVNPQHLEPVTIKENVMRGNTITALNSKKTHCIRGHALSGDNLYIAKKGSRVCKACHSMSPTQRRINGAYQ